MQSPVLKQFVLAVANYEPSNGSYPAWTHARWPGDFYSMYGQNNQAALLRLLRTDAPPTRAQLQPLQNWHPDNFTIHGTGISEALVSQRCRDPCKIRTLVGCGLADSPVSSQGIDVPPANLSSRRCRNYVPCCGMWGNPYDPWTFDVSRLR